MDERPLQAEVRELRERVEELAGANRRLRELAETERRAAALARAETQTWVRRCAWGGAQHGERR